VDRLKLQQKLKYNMLKASGTLSKKIMNTYTYVQWWNLQWYIKEVKLAFITYFICMN